VLTRDELDEMLDATQCTIVSELSNEHLDSYVLSESSLFFYLYKFVLKTCGTTKLLLSIPLILKNASKLSLSVKNVKYTRGTFIFAGV
jgi:S-adenosylmethionine decarboxylase